LDPLEELDEDWATEFAANPANTLKTATVEKTKCFRERKIMKMPCLQV